MEIAQRISLVVAVASTISLGWGLSASASTETAALTPASSAVEASSTSEADSQAADAAKESSESDAETKDEEKAEVQPKGPKLEERAKQWGDVGIAVRANEAARALMEKNFSAAQAGYRSLIGLDPNEVDFYIALYYSSAKSERWDHALLALEDLVDKKPEWKIQLADEFVQVLKKNHNTDDLPEYEALVKKQKSKGTIVQDRVDKLIERSLYVKEKPKPKPKIKPRTVVDEEDVHAHTSKFSLTYDNAFRSESIVVAKFLKYESDGPISYFRPPKAIYHIEEVMKGPPLNPTIPVRYEFHQKIDQPKPKGWKFSKDMMPKKDSKWILFIHNAVPIDGMLETYHGSFGRQEYNEENLDKILRIMETHKGQTR